MNRMFKAARYAIGLRAEDLAKDAKVSVLAVRTIEDGSRRFPIAQQKVLAALERRGVRVTSRSIELIAA